MVTEGALEGRRADALAASLAVLLAVPFVSLDAVETSEDFGASVGVLAGGVLANVLLEDAGVFVGEESSAGSLGEGFRLGLDLGDVLLYGRRSKFDDDLDDELGGTNEAAAAKLADDNSDTGGVNIEELGHVGLEGSLLGGVEVVAIDSDFEFNFLRATGSAALAGGSVHSKGEATNLGAAIRRGPVARTVGLAADNTVALRLALVFLDGNAVGRLPSGDRARAGDTALAGEVTFDGVGVAVGLGAADGGRPVSTSVSLAADNTVSFGTTVVFLGVHTVGGQETVRAYLGGDRDTLLSANILGLVGARGAGAVARECQFTKDVLHVHVPPFVVFILAAGAANLAVAILVRGHAACAAGTSTVDILCAGLFVVTHVLFDGPLVALAVDTTVLLVVVDGGRLGGGVGGRGGWHNSSVLAVVKLPLPVDLVVPFGAVGDLDEFEGLDSDGGAEPDSGVVLEVDSGALSPVGAVVEELSGPGGLAPATVVVVGTCSHSLDLLAVDVEGIDFGYTEPAVFDGAGFGDTDGLGGEGSEHIGDGGLRALGVGLEVVQPRGTLAEGWQHLADSKQ